MNPFSIFKANHEECARRCERCGTFHVWIAAGGRQMLFSEMDAPHLANTIALLSKRAERDAKIINDVYDDGNESSPLETVFEVLRPKFQLCMKAELERKLKELS